MIGPEDDDLLAGGTKDEELLHDDDTDQGDAEQSDADEADGDDGSAEAGEDGESDGDEDALGSDEGQAGQRPAEVGRQPSRAQARVQTALAKAKAAEDKASELERRLAQIEQGRTQQSTAQQQAEERERIALMTPDERTDYLVNKTRQEVNGEIQGLRFQMQDSADKTAFDALCARKPHFDAVRDDVEKQLVEMRRNGGTAPRETLALYFIGKRADERAGRAAPRQKRKADDRIQRQTARPGNGKGDQRNDSGRRGGDEKSARANRLKDLNI